MKYKSIIRSTFKNLVGYNNPISGSSGGGALQIVEQDVMKDPSNFLVISGSQFINNYNVNGGAISLTNVGNATIKDGTLFQGNYVDQAGGALFFYCSDYGLDFSKCSLFIESSIFVNNTAHI